MSARCRGKLRPNRVRMHPLLACVVSMTGTVSMRKDGDADGGVNQWLPLNRVAKANYGRSWSECTLPRETSAKSSSHAPIAGLRC